MAAPLTTGELPWNQEIHQERNKKNFKYEN